MSTTELATVKEESRQLDHMRSNRLQDSLFSKDLAPHYMQLAGKLATSELVPKCFRGKPQDLFICWSMGYQIGMAPEQAMQCIAVVNGKAVMWGDEMLALCMSHPDFEDIDEAAIRNKDDMVTGYVCTIKRKKMSPKINTFTLDMAKKAGLLGKVGPWTQYPERMLKLRARSFSLRDAFPDALKGIKPREEVEDYIDADYTISEHKGSRTELLKQEIITRMEANNVDAIHGSMANDEDKVPVVETTTREERQEEVKDCVQAPQLHIKIKELIAEKAFTDERLSKALAYYEVTTIEELDTQSAHDFTIQLLKL